jgi:hypothetical protein
LAARNAMFLLAAIWTVAPVAGLRPLRAGRSPPPFRLEHRLSAWPDCRLELKCCRGATILPVRLLAQDYGDRTFAELLRRLRCAKCKRPPAPVYLCAGHREHNHGAAADWAIELVPVRVI